MIASAGTEDLYAIFKIWDMSVPFDFSNLGIVNK
jgi:hypothetical protein